MRIVIDIQGMQTRQSKNRGVGRYIFEIVKEFIEISHNHDIILVANDNYGDTEKSLQNILGNVKIKFWNYHNDSIENLQKDRENFILQLKPDIVWMANLQEGFDEDTVTSIKTVKANCIWISTLYDVIPIIFKEEYLKKSNVANWYNEKISQTKKSDYIFTISDFSKKKISELLNFDKSKIFIIPPAVNKNTFNEEKPLIRNNVFESDFRKKILNKKQKVSKNSYILFVSGYNPHKNVQSLIEAYSILPESVTSNYRLLLIGKDLLRHHQNLLNDKNIKNIEFLDNVNNDDLINYYKNSSLFVFPSYAEGFGIPPLEAMACGIPTITSNSQSLPEVVGMKEAMFDPYDIQQMANMMHRALTDEEFREKLINNGLKRANHFCWKKSSKYMLECFENIYNMNVKR